MRLRSSEVAARRLAIGVAAIMLALAVGLVVTPSSARAESFEAFLDGIRRQAVAGGVDAEVVQQALAGVRRNPRIIELDRRQPEFTQTFWRYLERRVTDERISRGRALLVEHRALLEQVERRYGVPAAVLVALWGLESNYGSYTGDFRLFEAVATLAYDPRRGGFFRAQLLAALRGAGRGDIPLDARSSWAGAMGQPQFIPTTYESYAVDFDGDGRRDLWRSLPDIFASAANYLAASGWQADERWGREVMLPAGFDYARTGLERRRPVAEWAALGVRDARGGPLPEAAISAAVVLPGGASGGPAFLAYKNFQVILAWNRSELYAVAVGHLADRLAGSGPLVTPAPANEVALSQAQVRELQRLLASYGYDTGGIDGVVGSKTRAAIRGFQQRHGLPADGHPSIVVLRRLQQGPPR